MGLDYKSRHNWSKQRLASFWRLTSLIHMCENAMKVSKVGGIYFKKGIGGERGGGGIPKWNCESVCGGHESCERQ